MKTTLKMISMVCIGIAVYLGTAWAVELDLPDLDKQRIEKLLTPGEKDWISKHKRIKIAGPKAFPPFHYYEKDGALKGMSSDYIHLILKSLDVDAEIQSSLDWPEVLTQAKEKKIDLISCSAKTIERESYLEFTEPYLSFPLVIITRTDASFIGGLEDLHGKKVAFVEGIATYDWMRQDKIETTPVFVNTPLDALKAVSVGRAEAHIENLAAATYLIQKHGLANLKIAAPTSYGNYDLYIAVRRDWPELVSIINRILPVIAQEQHSIIRNRWLAVKYEYGIPKNKVIKWVLAISSLSLAILVVILFWNRRLSKEIKEREQAEVALRESENRFRELFNNMGSSVAVYDSPDNGQHFVFRDLNRSGLAVTKKQKEEVVGREVRDVFPGVETLGLFDVFQQVWKTEKPEHHPVGLYKDNTLSLWLENYVYKLPTGELVAIYEDKTAGKMAEEAKGKLERQLRQTQKMESIGNLAGGIAHDFNNILSAIIGYTELAFDHVEKGSMLDDNLQEVYKTGKRAKDLVKQILTFARKSDEEQKPVQVDLIAKEVLKLIRSTIPTTIEIRERFDSQSLIIGNPTQVHQLFLNLCTNAAQAMEDMGGVLEVGLVDEELSINSPLAQTGLKPGSYLKVIISDTGQGIPQDIIGLIFEPYFTIRQTGEGTGMGLAVVHGIVEAYSGKITVESEMGKGSVFSIYLPVTKKRGAVTSYEEEKLPSGNEHILLVDDELAVVRLGSQILERLGYKVTLCTGSMEALELFRSKADDFHLVITDMTMPKMTGDVLAAELIKIRSDLPIILSTGYSRKISDARASDIGIKAFVYKPVSKSDLAKIVRNVLDEAKRICA